MLKQEINPATLSGAIDVIVVEHTDGKTGETELACSPFHIRFGKLSVLRPVDRTVYIKVNGHDAPFHMKVGDTGEAFFVFETDQDVPDHLQTSPLQHAVGDEDISALSNEPDLLELGDSVTTLDHQNSTDINTAVSSDENHAAQTNSSQNSAEDMLEQAELSTRHQSIRAQVLEGMVGKAQAVGGAALELAKASNDRILRSGHAHAGKDKLQEAFRSGKAVLRGQRESAEGDQEDSTPTTESFVASELGYSSTSASLSSVKPFGDPPSPISVGRIKSQEDALDSASRHNRLNTPRQSTTSLPDEEHHRNNVRHADASKMSKTRSSDKFTGQPPMIHTAGQGDLMLDMDGYKMEEGPETIEDGAKTPPEVAAALTLANGNTTQLENGDISAANLLHEADPDVLALTRALIRISETEHTGNDLINNGASSETLMTRQRTLSEQNPDRMGDAYEYVLFSEGKTHTFEIALCHDYDPGAGSVLSQEFDYARISKDQFLAKPELLEDRDLYVRFRSRYFGWDNGSLALASLAIYRKTLIDSASKAPSSQPSGWRRWWGRGGGVRSRTTTSDSYTTNTTGAPSIASDMLAHEKITSFNDQEKGRLMRATSEPLRSATPESDLPSSPALSTAGTITADTTEQAIHGDKAQKHYAKTLRLTSDQLKQLPLKKGSNTLSFTVQSSFSGVAVVVARIFLWESDFQVVISDIDGTITKSDALGHVFTMIGRDWTHPGVAKLYTDIASNGYRFMYLTSRAIGQADQTREYLRGIHQNGYNLPEGPVIMSPDRLLTSLHREVVLRKPEVFKMACLRDIKRLFVDRNPFYAGFGNRLTDGLSYRSVEIPSSRIFTIDSSGNVKLELLELAGYSSTYIFMTSLVNETFPPVQRNHVPQYNDFNFWRAELPQIDLPQDLMPQPVSPTLSARSDTSRLSRVANIAASISRRTSRQQLRNPAGGTRSPFSTSPRSTSPNPLEHIRASDNEEDEDEVNEESPTISAHPDRKPVDLGTRQRNPDSMPGSFEAESFLDQMRDSLELDGSPSHQVQADRARNAQHANESFEQEEDLGDIDEDDLPDMDFGSVPYL